MTSCKKQKLNASYEGLAGTWIWINGWQDGGNTEYKLELIEKGKYKLYNGNDKIDFGRLVNYKDRIRFVSDKLFKKGAYSDDRHEIVIFRNDTILISNSGWTDYPTSTYVKGK